MTSAEMHTECHLQCAIAKSRVLGRHIYPEGLNPITVKSTRHKTRVYIYAEAQESCFSDWGTLSMAFKNTFHASNKIILYMFKK